MNESYKNKQSTDRFGRGTEYLGRAHVTSRDKRWDEIYRKVNVRDKIVRYTVAR